MFKTHVGTRLYVSVLSVFVAFAAAFIIFQHAREREYKINSLNARLQDYNSRMIETLEYIGDHSEKTLDRYVKNHHMHGLRVTLVNRDGSVVYDNMYKDYAKMDSHKNRDEVREAFSDGSGYDFSRMSSTMNQTYFYSATYVPKFDLVVRSALPYDSSLAETLKADQHYLWFTLVAMLILVFILYRFVSRLGDNITKLRLFASRADHNESLDTEDLVGFPGDELGEIAERIIKIYKCAALALHFPLDNFIHPDQIMHKFRFICFYINDRHACKICVFTVFIQLFKHCSAFCHPLLPPFITSSYISAVSPYVCQYSFKLIRSGQILLRRTFRSGISQDIQQFCHTPFSEFLFCLYKLFPSYFFSPLFFNIILNISVNIFQTFNSRFQIILI